MKNRPGLIISSILSIIGLIFTIWAIISKNASLESISTAICYGFILFYLFSGYKIPHGNMMKYLFLVYGFSLIVRCILSVTEYNYAHLAAYVYGLAAMFVCFMAGRLDRYDENKNLFIVTFCLIILAYILSIITSDDVWTNSVIYMAGSLIQWVSISMTYFTRHAEHKKAGSN